MFEYFCAVFHSLILTLQSSGSVHPGQVWEEKVLRQGGPGYSSCEYQFNFLCFIFCVLACQSVLLLKLCTGLPFLEAILWTCSSRLLNASLRLFSPFSAFLLCASVSGIAVVGAINFLGCLSRSCEHNIAGTLGGNFFKSGIKVHLDPRSNSDFGGQTS